MSTVYRIRKGKDNPNWEGIDFIRKALGSKDYRYALSYVHVEDNVAYGTDGHRLRWYELDLVIDDGNYELLRKDSKEYVLIQAEDSKLEYPNVKGIIPSIEGCTEIKITLFGSKDFQLLTQAMWNVTKKGVMINIAYLLDMFGHEWRCYIKPIMKEQGFTISPVRFDDDKYHAVIMPMRPASESARIS